MHLKKKKNQSEAKNVGGEGQGFPWQRAARPFCAVRPRLPQEQLTALGPRPPGSGEVISCTSRQQLVRIQSTRPLTKTPCWRTCRGGSPRRAAVTHTRARARKLRRDQIRGWKAETLFQRASHHNHVHQMSSITSLASDTRRVGAGPGERGSVL